MTFEEYQKATAETAVYPKEGDRGIVYTTLGMASEAGEVAGKYKKVIRDMQGTLSDEMKKEMGKEVGDVLWYVSQVCAELGLSLEDVAAENIAKLRSRKERGQLAGNGDNR